MKEFKYNIIKHIADISDPNEVYIKELNIVEWGDNQAKYDLRTWKHDKETGEVKAGKGLTLDKDEFEKLKFILTNLN